MKREILFKGKRVDTGEWVEGSLIGNDVIVGKIVEFEEDYFCTEFWNKVDPETVGQFTGLKDENGTRIFEGDMIRIGEIPDKQSEKISSILYMQDILRAISRNIWIEIIGNIHDNPELL